MALDVHKNSQNNMPPSITSNVLREYMPSRPGFSPPNYFYYLDDKLKEDELMTENNSAMEK